MDRLDNRTWKEFVANVIAHSEQEIKYAIDWLYRHNGISGRKKRDLSIWPWGCSDDMFRKSQEARICYKPDFLLFKNYDNKFMVKSVYPIEITTAKFFSNGLGYIKKSKIDWEYDKLTPQVCKTRPNSHYILFIGNTIDPGKELYTLLTPKQLRIIKKNGITYCPFLGGKPAYSFIVKKYNWKEVYPQNKGQKELGI